MFTQFKKFKFNHRNIFLNILLASLTVLPLTTIEKKVEIGLRSRLISNCFNNNAIEENYYPEELIVDSSHLVNKVAISQDGSIMATAVYDEIKLWNIHNQDSSADREIITSQNERLIKSLIEHNKQENSEKIDRDLLGNINSLAISHNENTNETIVASLGQGKQQFAVWRITDISVDPEFTLLNKSNSVNLGEIKSITISPNHKYVAIGSNNRILVWEINTDSIEKTKIDLELDRNITALTFSYDNETLILGSDNGEISILSVASNPNLLPKKKDKNTNKPITSLTISPNENIISVFDDVGILWKNLPRLSPQRRLELKGNNNQITSVVISPNNNNLVIGRFGGIIEFWNLYSQKRLHTCQIPKDLISTTPNVALSVNNQQQVKVITYGSQVINFWQLSYQQ
ncbi:MAG: hypothetical protein F6K40_37670 [Okeania sp. SIO3I5]|uniref:WD40 repeat domain-containing protein n=1 Tax=Okeania sp. SIO3I5 TaxID=2607805 RepID=UPI0013BE28EC|nr:hypothetical protein [Okeania sp. SIO3I5]NEQ41619.1 hypothetical protein [Okeania sp. SIO3I5]